MTTVRRFNNAPSRPVGNPSRHVIDDISYSKDFIVCTCSWKGPVDEYQPHRKKEEPERRSH